MDAPHAVPPGRAIPLGELDESRIQTPLHEARGNACHAFEMYGGRNAMVREAAYRRAQARGFEPGRELEDWLSAEREVDSQLFASIAPIGFVG